MSCTFITIYLFALVSVLLGIAGFIILIYGLINKKKRMTIYGSIMSFLAILIIISGVFWGARKVVHFAFTQYNYEMNIKNNNNRGNFGPGCFKMCEDMMNDTTFTADDSGKVYIEKKIIKCCGNMKNCDPATKCKSKCQH
jgi:hypothetical protein